MEQSNEEAREAELRKLRAKHDAYITLFGTAAKPSALGALVLADLDTFCTTFRESIHMDKQGRMDPYTTIYRDGKKAVALRIRQMIDWSENDDSNSNSDSGG